ncbi:MAG: hypothetical protein JRH10_20275, partial [Deltaproteobacteria bacterium]|nr:hypothetical protein [Deltaproteobacteria bacterium]
MSPPPSRSIRLGGAGAAFAALAFFLSEALAFFLSDFAAPVFFGFAGSAPARAAAPVAAAATLASESPAAAEGGGGAEPVALAGGVGASVPFAPATSWRSMSRRRVEASALGAALGAGFGVAATFVGAALGAGFGVAEAADGAAAIDGAGEMSSTIRCGLLSTISFT